MGGGSSNLSQLLAMGLDSPHYNLSLFAPDMYRFPIYKVYNGREYIPTFRKIIFKMSHLLRKCLKITT